MTEPGFFDGLGGIFSGSPAAPPALQGDQNYQDYANRQRWGAALAGTGTPLGGFLNGLLTGANGAPGSYSQQQMAGIAPAIMKMRMQAAQDELDESRGGGQQPGLLAPPAPSGAPMGILGQMGVQPVPGPAGGAPTSMQPLPTPMAQPSPMQAPAQSGMPPQVNAPQIPQARAVVTPNSYGRHLSMALIGALDPKIVDKELDTLNAHTFTDMNGNTQLRPGAAAAQAVSSIADKYGIVPGVTPGLNSLADLPQYLASQAGAVKANEAQAQSAYGDMPRIMAENAARQAQIAAEGSQQRQTAGYNASLTGGKALDEELGKGFAKTYNDVQESGFNAAGTRSQIAELRGAFNNAGTSGPLTMPIATAKTTLRQLGVDPDILLPKGMNDTQAQIAQKNVVELAMALAKTNFPGGRITNADLESAVRATPNFSNTLGANNQLLDNLDARMRLKQDQAQFYRQNKGLGPNVQDAWAEHVQNSKDYPEFIKESYDIHPAASAQPAPQASITAPAPAIAHLRANPALAAQFDAKYGPGASKTVLNNGR